MHVGEGKLFDTSFFCCSGDNNVKALMFGIKHVKVYF